MRLLGSRLLYGRFRRRTSRIDLEVASDQLIIDLDVEPQTIALLDRDHLIPLLVQKVKRHRNRQRDREKAVPPLHPFDLDRAKDLKRRTFD